MTEQRFHLPFMNRSAVRPNKNACLWAQIGYYNIKVATRGYLDMQTGLGLRLVLAAVFSVIIWLAILGAISA